MHERRYGFGDVIHGKMYVCGGNNTDGDLNSVEMYDPKKQDWNRSRYISLSLIAIFHKKLEESKESAAYVRRVIPRAPLSEV